MDPHPEPSASGGEISLDQWIALNNEIAALVRAGLPLERGLMGLGSDSLGRLGQISRDLAVRLEKGETLQQALNAERGRLPALYGAVVEAGVRSGRLPSALENLALYVRNYADMRHTLNLSLVYPLLVLVLAYSLFIAFLVAVIPRFLATAQEFRLPGLQVLHALDSLGRTAIYWAPLLPLLLVILLYFWNRAGKADAFGTRRGRGLLHSLPFTRRLLDDSAAASFSELLALLVDQGVPFPEAIELAGDASGDPALDEEARSLAAAVRRGEGIQGAALTARNGGLPSLLGWLLGAGYRQGALVPALQHAAQTYRRRTMERAALIRKLLPTLAIVYIGGFAVLVYTLTLFIPFSALLHRLAEAF